MTDRGWAWPEARILSVHDGDTVKVDVDLGFSTHAQVWVRLLGVGAPELDQPEGQTARDDVLAWLAEHAPDSRVQVTTWRTATPQEIRFRQSFTRYIGTVIAPNGAELNSYLRAKGYINQGD